MCKLLIIESSSKCVVCPHLQHFNLNDNFCIFLSQFSSSWYSLWCTRGKQAKESVWYQKCELFSLEGWGSVRVKGNVASGGRGRVTLGKKFPSSSLQSVDASILILTQIITVGLECTKKEVNPSHWHVASSQLFAAQLHSVAAAKTDWMIIHLCNFPRPREGAGLRAADG